MESAVELQQKLLRNWNQSEDHSRAIEIHKQNQNRDLLLNSTGSLHKRIVFNVEVVVPKPAGTLVDPRF